MKIALLGYGKMGKEIEKISITRGHTISLIKDKNDFVESINNTDVAIDFSTPDSAYDNIKLALNSSVPVISGTTGWLKNYDKIVEFSKKTNTSFLYSSNYSLGVNLFFELNKKLAKLISNHNDYEVSISETHHLEKLDKPSGTAITIAEDIINNSKYQSWAFEKNNSSEIKMESLRITNVPGTHIVNYSSEIDSIEIKHIAHNRKGFAVGAVVAAEWIIDKKGVFDMSDVIKDSKLNFQI
ncbi:MAG: 4-hydroxy-tetrahydrodipicolinate reductase [Flavobacteriaceae bacterium]|nr:4-hydroxy-tetrahydrodipicolinate reductase [Flavobacteriaceae bacterium]